MKKAILIHILMLFVSTINAQYYSVSSINSGKNPRNINRDAEVFYNQGLPDDWLLIYHNYAFLPQWTGIQYMPFDFKFNGSPVTQFKVSTSGVLTFNTTVISSAPPHVPGTIPNLDLPTQSVCIWGLNATNLESRIVKKVFGTAPNRQLWIQFNKFGYADNFSDDNNYCIWSIVLEESTNHIHMVDHRTKGLTDAHGLLIGIQTDRNTAYTIPGNTFIYPETYSNSISPDDNTFYTFIYDEHHQFDLSIEDFTIPDFLEAGSNFTTGIINNFGGTTITDFQLSYQINNGNIVSSQIQGANILPKSSYFFTHPIPWFADSGYYEIKAWTSNLNGSETDQNLKNDTFIKKVFVLPKIIKRVPLFEVFNSSTCVPCQQANVMFHSIVDTIKNTDYIFIKYPQNIPNPGDPYSTDENIFRRSLFYRISSVPRLVIDGEWQNDQNNFAHYYYEKAHKKPAFAQLSGHYNINDKTIAGKVFFTPYVTPNKIKLYIAVFENFTSRNFMDNGERRFRHVMKKMIPTQEGILINTDWNTPDTISFSYTFNGNYRLPPNGLPTNTINHLIENSVEYFPNLRVIAWLQDDAKNVLQAANLTLSTNVVQSTFNDISNIQVYPNPSKGFINVQINLDKQKLLLINIIDDLGKVVYNSSAKYNKGPNQERINVEQIANGNYHLIILDEHGNSFIKQVSLNNK